MPSWRKSLEPNDVTNSSGVVHWLRNKNLFPRDMELVVTKHGSVDKEVIIKVLQHINMHARKTVPADEYILLLVDGYSSRQADVWLQKCEKRCILVVKLPANTAHLLQPCDQSVNKLFQCIVY